MVVPGCGGLTLAECQLMREAALLLSSSRGQGSENIMKGSLVEISHQLLPWAKQTRLGEIIFQEYGNEK